MKATEAEQSWQLIKKLGYTDARQRALDNIYGSFSWGGQAYWNRVYDCMEKLLLEQLGEEA